MTKQQHEFDKHKEVYNELAERRTIEMLGLTEKEVIIAQAYETTKVVELTKIQKEVEKRQNQYIKKPSFWSLLFG